MAKTGSGLKETLSLGKKEPIGRSTVNVEQTEAIAKKLDTVTVTRSSKKSVRLSTDLSEEDFIQFKMKLLKEGKNRKGQDVVRELINQWIYS